MIYFPTTTKIAVAVLIIVMMVLISIFNDEEESQPDAEDGEEQPGEFVQRRPQPNSVLTELPSILTPGTQEICFEAELATISTPVIYKWQTRIANKSLKVSRSQIFCPELSQDIQRILSERELIALCVLSCTFREEYDIPQQELIEFYVLKQNVKSLLFSIDRDRLHAELYDDSGSILINVSTLIRRWKNDPGYGSSVTYLRTDAEPLQKEPNLNPRELDSCKDSSYQFAEIREEVIKQFLLNFS